MARQDFKLVNVDKWMNLERGASMAGELNYNGEPEALISLLTIPDLVDTLASESQLIRTRKHNITSQLVRLPQEVLDAITAELRDPISLLSLAITCSYLWRVLLPRVRKAITTIKAPWAGDRLVFVGSSAEGVPKGCEDYEEARLGEFHENSDLPEYPDNNPLYCDITAIVQRPLPMEKQFEDCPDTQLLMRLYQTLRRYPESKLPGVLRNLTKRQYVLDTKVAQDCWPCNLGQFVICLTEWETNGCDAIGTGDWAGDRIDIRSTDNISEGWTDISEKIVAHMADNYLFSEDEDYYIDNPDMRTWVE
ncbi:uncharacterized protein F4822DRAFT_442506 [Hypoxylon trugodes]|uniref:uncharacterized protein n=1 Tax=Hypoxylon trugodes TaxID=326681 RepID=UPI0021915175|nr:uncharacterized protein F4822DRAFT_442506 [Hypoxylon trugodes]KAI1391560.1 hypothetical protein F4822DRAFT_442506 [Hypoxylon trugodes]